MRWLATAFPAGSPGPRSVLAPQSGSKLPHSKRARLPMNRTRPGPLAHHGGSRPLSTNRARSPAIPLLNAVACHCSGGWPFPPPSSVEPQRGSVLQPRVGARSGPTLGSWCFDDSNPNGVASCQAVARREVEYGRDATPLGLMMYLDSPSQGSPRRAQPWALGQNLFEVLDRLEGAGHSAPQVGCLPGGRDGARPSMNAPVQGPNTFPAFEKPASR